jgi:hypothetical protein
MCSTDGASFTKVTIWPMAFVERSPLEMVTVSSAEDGPAGVLRSASW